MNHVGILAYGSLLDDPGREIRKATASRIEGVWTPFHVEFARSSRSRENAPTLVPVSVGGAPVPGTLFVLSNSVSIRRAKAMLYWRVRQGPRRSTRKARRRSGMTGQGEIPAWIHEISSFAGIETVLYVALPQNIPNPTPRHLAELAIASARGQAGKDRRDGISYLIAAKRNGVSTPLMAAYETEILRMTGTLNALEAAAAVAGEGTKTISTDSGEHAEQNVAADSLDFAVTNLQKTYEIFNQRTMYLDGRATAFLGLLSLAGATVAAFTTLILTSASGASSLASVRGNPLVSIPFALALISYVAAALCTAMAGRVMNTAAPDFFDKQPPAFDPEHPEAFPAKMMLQGILLSDTWAAITEINDRVNASKHNWLVAALAFVVAAIFFASLLSAAVFATVPGGSPSTAATATAAPTATP